MAVTVRAIFPAGTTTATTTGAVTTITTSVTVVSGDVLEVHTNLEVGTDTGFTLACKFDPAGTNVSPDGQSAIVHSNGQTAGFEQVFYYLTPAVGTFNVTVTASGGTPADMDMKCLALAGSNNAAPTVTTFAPSGTGTTTAMTITSTSVSGGLVTGHFCAGSGISSVNNTQQCIAQNGIAIGAASAIGVNSASGTGSNVTMTGTLGGADWYAAIALAWAPAGGALQGTLLRPLFMQGALQPASLRPPPIAMSLPYTWAIVPPLPAMRDKNASPFFATVDPAHRYLGDPVGNPLMPTVDHQWHLIGWGGGRSELGGGTTPLGVFQAYASHQASKGFNGALVMAICSDQGGPLGPFTDGRTWDGIAPWGAGGIGDLNPTYWARVDDMLNSFAAQNITCWLNIVASYTIASGTALAGITTTNATTYGTALAARYKDFPNIVWHIGADYFGTKEAEFANIVTALRNGGDTHLVTAEYMAESNSRVDSGNVSNGAFGNSGVISYDDIYTYNAAYFEVEHSYGLTSPSLRPALYFNGRYDQNTTGYDTVELDDILWALTSGSPGHFYGSEATWKWEATSYNHVLTDNLPNVWLPLMRAFWTGLSHWERLVPDFGAAFITSARGTKVTALASGGGATAYTGGNTYLTGGVTPDGTLAVLYTPTNRTITIDGSKMVATYTGKWVDPYTFAVTAAASSATSYATPGTNSQGDNRWLLVLQEAAAGSLSTGATVPLTDTITSAGAVGTATGATISLTATVTAAGVVGRSTGVTVSETVTVTAAGTVGAVAGSTVPLVDTVTSSGVVGAAIGAAISETVTVTAAGFVALAIGATLPLTDTISSAGAIGTSTGAAVALTDTIASAGVVGTSSGVSIALTAAITSAGSIGGGSVSQGATVPLTDTVTSAGTVGAASGASVPLTDAVTSAGVVGVAAGASVPLADVISSGGFVGRSTTSTVPLTDAITSAGVVGRATGATIALTVAVTSAGSVSGASTSQGASVPLTFAVTASGTVGTATGAARPISVTVTAGGIVGTSTGAAIPLTVTIIAAGSIAKSGTAALQLNATVTAAGTVSGAVVTTPTPPERTYILEPVDRVLVVAPIDRVLVVQPEARDELVDQTDRTSLIPRADRTLTV